MEKLSYCLQSQKASPPSGSYVAQVLDSNKNLQKVLYYGYGGAGDLTGSYLSGKSEDEKYVYTHIAASYAYAGEAGFTGCNYNDLVNAGVIAYINYLFGQEEPPKRGTEPFQYETECSKRWKSSENTEYHIVRRSQKLCDIECAGKM